MMKVLQHLNHTKSVSKMYKIILGAGFVHVSINYTFEIIFLS